LGPFTGFALGPFAGFAFGPLARLTLLAFALGHRLALFFLTPALLGLALLLAALFLFAPLLRLDLGH
ncbi:hypothetical protein, partial [Stenotrophomonas maltophilia]|uniref:hypothetical protein n=1 Tax=Stenotrophomonas maltophilia TaxID=40324 RepID=UPI0013DAC404